MPRFDISRRDARRQQQFQQDATQQQLDQQGQSSMLNQLSQLYDISQSGERNALAQKQFGLQQDEFGLRKQMAPSQIAQSEAEAKYRQAVAAGYPEDIASIIASRNSGTEQNKVQTAGMQQQQSFAPAEHDARVRGANATSAAQEFENQWAQPNAMAKSEHNSALTEGQRLQNQGAQSDLAWEEPFKQQKYAAGGAAIDVANAQAKRYASADPSLLPYLQSVGATQEDLQGMYLPPEIQARHAAEKSVRDAADAAERAKIEERSGLTGTNLPPAFLDDPEIKKLLFDQQAEQDYYKPGGGLEIELARSKIKHKVHPIRSAISDIYNLYR